MRPLIKYRGGKSKEIPTILRYLPQYTGRYVEPFFGGGALFFYLEPQKAIINDINKKLMCFYQGVKQNYPIVRKELDELELLYTRNRKAFDDLKAKFPEQRIKDDNEELYYRLRNMFNGLGEKEFTDATLYYFINKTAYSGMIRYNAKGEFNVPFGRYAHLNTDNVTLRHCRLLQQTEIYNEDYSKIFDFLKPNDFVFLDPPYDCAFSDYGNGKYQEDFNELSHRRLAEDFRNLPCKALMVIGLTPLTESLYGENIAGRYAKNYAVNIRNRFKSSAEHIIVTNYQGNAVNSIFPVTQNKVYAQSERKQNFSLL